jgi:hypothetical protein
LIRLLLDKSNLSPRKITTILRLDREVVRRAAMSKEHVRVKLAEDCSKKIKMKIAGAD